MAIACVNGARECNGCGKCHNKITAVGKCAECGDPVYSWEWYYNIEGELVHSECLADWAEKYRVKP